MDFPPAGFVPDSAWIAHCKELFGLAAPGTSHNENLCPPERSQRLSKRSDASDSLNDCPNLLHVSPESCICHGERGESIEAAGFHRGNFEG